MKVTAWLVHTFDRFLNKKTYKFLDYGQAEYFRNKIDVNDSRVNPWGMRVDRTSRKHTQGIEEIQVMVPSRNLGKTALNRLSSTIKAKCPICRGRHSERDVLRYTMRPRAHQRIEN